MGDRTLVVNCTVPDTYDSAILVCKPDSEPTGPDDGMSKVITKGTTNTEFDVSEYIGNTYTYKLYGGIGSEIHDNDDATTFYDDYGDEITAEPFDVVTIETEDYDVYDFFICTTDMKWISIGHTVEYEPYTCYEPPSYGELIANELNGDIIQENVCNGSVLSTLTINGVNIPISYGDTIFLAETTFSSSSLLTYIYPGVWFNKTLLNDFKCGSTEFEITSTLDAIRYRYIGELDSDLNDGDTTNPVMINGVSVTAKPYDYCNYSSSSHTFMFTEKSKWVLRDDSNYNIIANASTATINKEIKEGVSYKTLKINGVKTKVNYWDYIINVNNVYNNNYIFLPPGVWVREYKIVNGYTNFYIDYGETIAVADNAIIGLIEQEIDVNRFYFKIFTDHNESNLINYDFDRDDKIYYVSPILYEDEDMMYEYSGNDVKLIGGRAFANCSDLSIIDCPECEYIDAGAFCDCKALTSISFPKCEYIGDSAFTRCSNLSIIDCPECTDIGNYAFANCSNLSSIIIPNMDYIPEGAFRYCISLSSIDFAINCEYIGSTAFEHCDNLSSISFPLCKHIGEGAFYSCNNLQNASFPECEYIEAGAFEYCSSLTYIDFPKCSYIEAYAFEFCNSLLSVNLPECGYIGSSAFAHCTYLSSIFLPECGIIGPGAFKSCFRLSYAKFSKCRYIYNNAFYSCSSLAILDLSLVSSVPSLEYSTAFYGTKLSTTGSIYVPASLYSNFRRASNWFYYSNHMYSV